MDIPSILEKHKLWLARMDSGERAYLSYATLRDADLRYADLRYATLRGVDLRDADLRYADLRYADLRYADLRYADLRDATLRGVNLRDADLRYADLHDATLRDATLRDATLRGVNISGVNLRDTDLRYADLRDATLRGVDLRGVDLNGALLPPFSIVPSEGSFVAWKKITTGVIKVLIPEDSPRTSTLVGRKCRASHVIVLEGNTGVSSTHKEQRLEYKVGETVYADFYDDDIRVECTHGIHFFMTKEEAEAW